MQEKSLKVLEFYKIRDMLVERAASGLGKARCAALVPVSDIREIERMQAETEEASTLVARTGVQPSPPLTTCRRRSPGPRSGESSRPRTFCSARG